MPVVDPSRPLSLRAGAEERDEREAGTIRIVVTGYPSMPHWDQAEALGNEGCRISLVDPLEHDATSVGRHEPDAVIVVAQQLDASCGAFKLFRALRASRPRCICVVIAQRLISHDVFELFQAGGDDYLLAPVSARDLVSRLRVLRLRRAALPPSTAELLLGPLRVDAFQRVFVNGNERCMPKKELSLLLLLGHYAGSAVSHEQLRVLGWQSTRPLGSNSLQVHLSRLRRWLREELGPGRIEINSIRGTGYALTLLPDCGQTGAKPFAASS
jgi:DNA-binding response OmpR family regulator